MEVKDIVEDVFINKKYQENMAYISKLLKVMIADKKMDYTKPTSGAKASLELIAYSTDSYEELNKKYKFDYEFTCDYKDFDGTGAGYVTKSLITQLGGDFFRIALIDILPEGWRTYNNVGELVSPFENIKVKKK